MHDQFTLIVGPQTTTAYALNAYVRQFGGEIQKAGVKGLPVRAATQFLSRVMNPERSVTDCQADFRNAISEQPHVLCALNFFGSPEAALKGGSFYANPEGPLERLGALVGPCRIVLLIDSLPCLFLAPGAPRLEARVKATGWERLFELSWSGLVRSVSDALPEAEIAVVTPKGAALRSADVLSGTFYRDGKVPGDPNWLLSKAISETGHAALDRLDEGQKADASTLEDLYASFAIRPTATEIEDRLGIEKITATLLDQRLEEDLTAISSLPRVEVI